MEKTLLVITPGRETHKGIFHLLVADTGECIASHYCSNAVFALGDLYTLRENRVKELKERFGDVEVKYIDETNISKDELKSRNDKWCRLVLSEK
jgi:hypothetical protein